MPRSDADRVARLEPPTDPGSLVLDTDAYNEVDDQFAIVWALRSDWSVEALYAAPFHNDRSEGPADGMEQSYEELQRLLEMLDADASRAHRGATRYLPGPETPVDAPAVDDLVARARDRDPADPLYVVAIGTPTNVASALLRAPEIADRIVVVWLGGQPHGWRTAREFNLQQDPHAARVLFGSGVSLVQVPCKNVAEHLTTSVPELDAHLRGGGEVAEFLADRFADYRRGTGVWSKEIWDLAAVAWLIDPDWVPTHLAPSPLLTEDLTWSHDPDRHLVRVARDVDRDAVFADAFDRISE